MRIFLPTAAVLIVGVLLLAPEAGQALSLGDLGGLFGSRVDKELVAQVPKDKRGAMEKADFDLAVANEEIALAKLKEDLADKQSDLASLATKLAKAQGKAAELALDSARIEAVMAANLGKAEENQKILDGLRVDRTKNEAEIIQLKSKMAQMELFIRDLTGRVAAKDKSLAELKARRGPAAAPAPAAKPDLKVDPKAPLKGEPVEIVNQAPPAPAPAAPPAPEGDLRN